MATTTTDALGDTIPVIIEEARYTEQFKEVISKLCWRITKGVKRGSTINLPYWGNVVANDLQENIDMVNPQAMTDTNVRFTPTEVGTQILVTKNTIEDDQEDVIRAAGRILGDAMVVKRETDLAGQFDDGTDTMGGAGQTMTLGHIAAAWANLSGVKPASGGPAPKPYVTVHHPFVLLDMVDVFTPTLAPSASQLAPGTGVAENALMNYRVGHILGQDIFECGNIAIDSSTDDAKGATFASGKGGGLVLATAREWDIEPEYDASLRATELNVVGRYDVGEYLASWIVTQHQDATAPA